MPVTTHFSAPPVLSAAHVCKDIAGRRVLDDISLVVGPGTRLGVVGPNGVGKSTLLRLLAGIDKPTSGRVEVSTATATVGYLAQQPERSWSEQVRSYLARATGVAEADLRLQVASDALARGEPGAGDTYSAALERWQDLGAADFDTRVGEAFEGSGIPPRLLELPTAALSGGQAASVALAAVVLSRYSVCLLDEPTNNLDFDGLARLEDFVARQSGGIVVVSHDRAFLEAGIDSVLELDEHSRTGCLFNGGWSAYLEEKATARRHAQEAYRDYEAQRRALGHRAQRERQWATKGASREARRPRDNDKAQRGFRVNRTEQLAARARRTEQAISRLERIEKPWQDWDLRFKVAEAHRSGAVVARLARAVVERGSFRLGPLDLEIGWGERVALAGRNGSGKTTLVEALLGRAPLESGRRWLGPSVVVGELGQDRGSFLEGASLLDSLIALSGLDLTSARSLLAKFGLGADHMDRSAATLSPGELTRAELAGFQARAVNLLVLDEPTNHLDLPAVEQLEEALAGYSGTLLLVSHDRRLLDAVDLTRTIQL
ncbi:MAG: ABC-F family ATP-binding cassette domain-containing protein [Acidimicrobiales bacterium]